MLRIEMTGIGKDYPIDRGRVCTALHDVSLTIEEGEFIAIVGRSGAGKSTLLHILGAMEPPTRGEYRLNGEDIAHAGDAKLARLRNTYMGFVLQEFALINDLTVAENVLLPAYFNDRPLRAARGQAAALLERVGLSALAGKRARQLSGGERQRVAIARALINDPALILADEPTGNLDSATAASIFALFEQLQREGRTVVMVTHDDALAARCGRLLRIADGTLV